MPGPGGAAAVPRRGLLGPGGPDGEALAQRISEAVWNLGGEEFTFASAEEAGLALAGALAVRRPMLLVADDVWTHSQLAPFVRAGQPGGCW